MAGTQIEIPSFNFAAFFYPQILESLLVFKRQNVPELTDESEFEPSIQLLRAFALVGHLNNVLADMIANESTLPTAKLPETVRNMLRLIDFELRPATPAAVEVILDLSRVFTVSRQVVPERAQYATRRTEGDNVIIYFESLSSLTIDRTDEFTAVLATPDGTTFTDYTTQANTGTTFTPWTAPAPGGAIYFGHAQVQHNRLDLDVITAPGEITNAVWEFFDGDYRDVAPDTMINVGGGVLRFNINDLLGDQNRAGAEVRVQLNETTTSETATSQWDGSNNYVETNLLGQASPSTDAVDYTVGVQWQELDNVNDETQLLGQTGTNLVEFDLPQNELRAWRATEVDGVESFWLRLRIVETSGAAQVQLGRIRMDEGDQYVMTEAIQGRSIIAETLGSSNGDANQRFPTTSNAFILNSQTLRVDSEVWVQVENFLSSRPQDKHYVVELGQRDRATIVFGDGVNGRIPDVGQGNIEMDYRFGAADDGNVGARTVTVDKTGLTFINGLFNPRPGAGWAEAQSDSPASLEKAKVEGPASLRAREVAISPTDMEQMVTRFVQEDGSSPFSRAVAIEEGFGPKTVELVVVARGGGQATGGQLEALDTFFNGDPTAVPPLPKRMVANQEVTSVNFDPEPINVEAIVTAPANITAAQVRNQLAAILQPEAIKEDGVTFVWVFGAEIPRSRIIHEIFETDPTIGKVVLNVPATDTQLQRRQLPANGTFTITMVEATS